MTASRTSRNQVLSTNPGVRVLGTRREDCWGSSVQYSRASDWRAQNEPLVASMSGPFALGEPRPPGDNIGHA